MTVPTLFAAVTTATGAQLDANFAACAQLDAANNLTNQINYAPSVVLTSAATVNIGAAASNNITISGTNAVSAFDVIGEGALRYITYSGAVPLTYNAVSMQLIGGVSRTVSVGDNSIFRSLGSGNWKEEFSSRSTTYPQLPSFTCVQASNALTVSAISQLLDFRSATLTTGTPVTISTGTPTNLVIPATSNLGMLATTVSNRLVILEAYNAGTPVLCVVNIAGGNQLDETNLISPTTIGASSNTANIIYSAVACGASTPYRVIGFVDVVFTTGTGWSSPTLVQPCGGEALTAMSSLGYGQSWKSVTRTIGTTYYNTTGKPIKSFTSLWTGSLQSAIWGANVNGLLIGYSCQPNSPNNIQCLYFDIPAGASYSVSNIYLTGTPSIWMEFS